MAPRYSKDPIQNAEMASEHAYEMNMTGVRSYWDESEPEHDEYWSEEDEFEYEGDDYYDESDEDSDSDDNNSN
jgi:hypothetical protein